MIKNQTPPELREWLKHFRALILAPLFRNTKSAAFRKPVDAVALGIYPIYFQVRKKITFSGPAILLPPLCPIRLSYLIQHGFHVD